MANPSTTSTPTSAGELLAELSASSEVRTLLEELRQRWSTGVDRMREIAGYALLAPGKMLRPLLLLAATEAVGGDCAGVLPAALAVEYLHVATLIHDDVIDDDDLRRGRPSVHARYGMADALVAGDFLILTMVSTLSECAAEPAATLEAARVLAVAGADVCRGQTREAELASDPSCPPADYEAMVALKTGALFRGACRAGAVLGGGAPDQVEAITRYAEHLGVAFQIYDDLLPYLADAAITGKPSTSDVGNLRPTYPVLMGYQSASPAIRTRFADVLSGRMPVEQSYPLMQRLLTDTGAIRRSQTRCAAEVAAARRCLAELPGPRGVELLAAIAELSVDRDR
ncbi:MAG TPA: polyprenyl synthetase family protein [Pseudonocardiaceae bacterium]|jgi:geranylgeranyl diphosphate synthase type I|nr:polyprenyl synthetase family protein [Pseudonocardiaceae bacterium]